MWCTTAQQTGPQTSLPVRPTACLGGHSPLCTAPALSWTRLNSKHISSHRGGPGSAPESQSSRPFLTYHQPRFPGERGAGGAQQARQRMGSLKGAAQAWGRMRVTAGVYAKTCAKTCSMVVPAGRGGQHSEAGEAVWLLAHQRAREGPRQGGGSRGVAAVCARVLQRAGVCSSVGTAGVAGLGCTAAPGALQPSGICSQCLRTRPRRWRRRRVTSTPAAARSPTGCSRPRCSPCAPSSTSERAGGRLGWQAGVAGYPPNKSPPPQPSLPSPTSRPAACATWACSGCAWPWCAGRVCGSSQRLGNGHRSRDRAAAVQVEAQPTCRPRSMQYVMLCLAIGFVYFQVRM